MVESQALVEEVQEKGFAVINDVLTSDEVDALLATIAAADTAKPTFRRTSDLFAIRQFFKEVPDVFDQLFNHKLKSLLTDAFGHEYFIVKSIYFDKPETSNWFVSYHQDLTISVNQKLSLPGFGTWTVKQDQFAVQPPIELLQDNLTLRIHLDDTTRENGALRVIPKSHRKGIYRPENINWQTETEAIYEVRKGGVMFMKPLLLHASSRTTNQSRRRVIHVELSRSQLPTPLTWSEHIAFT